MRNTRKKRTAATRSTAGLLLYAADMDGQGNGSAIKMPLSQGGTHERTNLIALCRSCHAKIHAENGDRWHNR